MSKIIITTDCVCDLSEELIEMYDIKIIHFYVVTEHGWFKDLEEITSDNIVEYFERGGNQLLTKAPFREEYEAFFEKVLKEGDEILHVAVSSSVSLSCKNATAAAERFGGRVQVIDSHQLSTGMAHLVLKAHQMVNRDKTAEEIKTELEAMRERIVTGFIAENANYLYRAGHVGKFVKNMCELLKIHPVLGMKNGNMRLKGVKIGNYENAVRRYVRKEMRRPAKIEKERVFITHSGCNLKLVTAVKREVARLGSFGEVLETEASATISSNCGANTIGVLFVRK